MALRKAMAATLALLLSQVYGDGQAELSPSQTPAIGAQQNDQVTCLLQLSQGNVVKLQGDASTVEVTNTSVLELVVASYCEDTEWFKPHPGPIAVYAKNPGCLSELQEAVKKMPAGGRLVELPNLGREGDSYVEHIIANYDNLAEYTAFTQGGGEHNGVKAINFLKDFQPTGVDKTSPLIPMVFCDAETHRYFLYRDMDKGEPKAEQPLEYQFEYFPQFDIANRVRKLYTYLFGGSACHVPAPVFAAGAQFIVHRDAIRAKPLAFWKMLRDNLVKWPNFGYDLERMWLFVFDPTLKPLDDISIPDVYHTGPQSKWRDFECEQYNQTRTNMIQRLQRPDACTDREHRQSLFLIELPKQIDTWYSAASRGIFESQP
mmetsp:Transcript_139186/g.259562  ORF Transcript_139186/g.259562 Transcript_139186/m.259562 type:complete len:374 (+) Transcript_139186:125-1246(+)